jgi:hypothetical protein
LIEVSIEDYKKLAELPKMSSSFPEWLIPSGVTDPFGVKYVWIPQGGAMYEASYGATSLAEELEDYILSYDSKLPWQVLVVQMLCFVLNHFILTDNLCKWHGNFSDVCSSSDKISKSYSKC